RSSSSRASRSSASSGPGRPATSTTSSSRPRFRSASWRRTTTPLIGHSTRRNGTMFPRGDTPEKVRQFYLYLQGHQESTHRVDSWHVDWLSLAWLWGFVISLVVVLLLWARQYRT